MKRAAVRKEPIKEKASVILPDQLYNPEFIERTARMMRFILSDSEYNLLLHELKRLKPGGNHNK